MRAPAAPHALCVSPATWCCACVQLSSGQARSCPGCLQLRCHTCSQRDSHLTDSAGLIALKSPSALHAEADRQRGTHIIFSGQRCMGMMYSERRCVGDLGKARMLQGCMPGELCQLTAGGAPSGLGCPRGRALRALLAPAMGLPSDHPVASARGVLGPSSAPVHRDKGFAIL